MYMALDSIARNTNKIAGGQGDGSAGTVAATLAQGRQSDPQHPHKRWVSTAACQSFQGWKVGCETEDPQGKLASKTLWVQEGDPDSMYQAESDQGRY